LIGSFSHGQKFAVLNNHSFFDNGLNNETFTYDDSGKTIRISWGRDILMARQFAGLCGGHAAEGIWILSMVNDSS